MIISYFIFLFSLFPILTNAKSPELVDKIMVVVNNEFIAKSDIESFKSKITSGKGVDDILLLGATQETLKKDPKAQLDYLINERIIDSEIKRLNLTVTLERVEQEIRDLAKRNGMTRSALLEAIKEQGFSVSEYQAFIKTRLERQSLIEQEISSKIRVSDEDVMAAFIRLNPKQETGAYEYALSHIFFNPKKGGPRAAEERAAKVLGKLSAGGVFDELAEQNSEDPGFSTGGQLGNFKSGEMNKDFEAAVVDLEVGKFSRIVKTKMGFHILKLNSKKVVADPRFEKEKEKLRGQLFNEAFIKHLRTWLEAKREDSYIKFNN